MSFVILGRGKFAKMSNCPKKHREPNLMLLFQFCFCGYYNVLETDDTETENMDIV